MRKEKKYNAWIKGSFYCLTVYAVNKAEARKEIKQCYGIYPYFIQEIK